MACPSKVTDTAPDDAQGHQRFTFGIELEILFGVEHNQDNHPVDNFLDFRYPDNPYNRLGSGIGHKNEEPNPSPSPKTDLQLMQIASILRDRGLPVVAIPYQEPNNLYDHWSVTKQRNVINCLDGCTDQTEDWIHTSLSSTNLMAKSNAWSSIRLGTRSTSETTWRFDSATLVSRALELPHPNTRFPHPDFCEVKKYIKALLTNPRDRFVTLSQPISGGLHVQVRLHHPELYLSQPRARLDSMRGESGRSTTSPRQLPLRTLQHLAFMLIEYEDVICEFHHPERRGTRGSRSDSLAETNRLGVQLQRHICSKPTLPTLQKVWRRIFRHDMTYDDLATLMDMHTTMDRDNPGTLTSRNKFVNFEPLKHTERAPTIDFRQHGGTLDADHVERWLEFLTKLMRAAEKKATQETPPPSPIETISKPWGYYPEEHRPGRYYRRQGMKYSSIRVGTKAARRDQFFALLEMTCDEMIYWSKIAIGFDTNAFARDETEEHVCDECLNEQIANDECWEPPDKVCDECLDNVAQLIGGLCFRCLDLHIEQAEAWENR